MSTIIMNYVEPTGDLPDKTLLKTKKLEEKGNNSEIKNVTASLSGKIAGALSDSKEFLKGKRGLVIDEDDGSCFLAQACLEKLGAKALILKNTESIEMYMDNVDVDFIIFCPKFKKDAYKVLCQEDIEFLDFMKEQYKGIPIFAYTADILTEQMETLKSLEFASIITKPTNLSKFGDSLKEQLRPDLYDKFDNILSQATGN